MKKVTEFQALLLKILYMELISFMAVPLTAQSKPVWACDIIITKNRYSYLYRS